jgi:N-acetylmuramoyl-L-alanine amidase
MTAPPAIAWRPSPNFNERRGGPIDILLLHYTGMPTEERALDWLCDPQSKVSSHYFVFSDGRLVQMVEEDKRAWHAGAAEWCGESDINSRSIGIEIANLGHAAPGGSPPPFADIQIEAVIALCRAILARHAIPAHRVLAHSDVAPLRKADPGERFPWVRLARAGVSHWVEPEPLADGFRLALGDEGAAVEALQGLLALYGYGVPISGQYDEPTHAVVTAFQRHFRPGLVDGAADVSTLRTLFRLIAALP